MTVTKIPSRNAWYTYGHGPLIPLLQQKHCARCCPSGLGRCTLEFLEVTQLPLLTRNDYENDSLRTIFRDF